MPNTPESLGPPSESIPRTGYFRFFFLEWVDAAGRVDAAELAPEEIAVRPEGLVPTRAGLGLFVPVVDRGCFTWSQ